VHYESPQELLQEIMRGSGLSAKQLAIHGLLPLSLTMQIVQGTAPITDDVAEGLERVTGIDSTVWTLLEERSAAENATNEDA
jgi:plasmid maintenance system antidote protein VapI